MKFYLVLFAVFSFSCAGNFELSEQQFSAGKKLAFGREKGNCLACHAIADGESPGNIGPPLTGLSARFKDKQSLREQIWDAGRFNPETSMPPFGKNNILSDREIDSIVDYLWSLD